MDCKLPTDALTPRDIGALNAELTDPRFKDEFWMNEIVMMLKFGKEAEQQALAKYRLDFVTDRYLREKLGGWASCVSQGVPTPCDCGRFLL